MRKFVLGLCIAFGLLPSAFAVSVTDQDLPGKGRTVRPIFAGSPNSVFQHYVLQIGLERLGYTVADLAESKYPTLHLAIANGDADFTAQHWRPLHNEFFEKAGGDAKMTRVGHLITGTVAGYLIDKKTSEKYGITRIDQLRDPKLAALFDSDGDGKANLAGCDPGWGCERVIEYQLTEYKLRDTVTHDQGSYFALIADVMARYKTGKPILYHSWTPLWVNQALVPGKDVVWLEVPYTALPADQKGSSTIAPDGKNLGFPVNEQIVLANNNFLKANPAARRWFELVVISIDDISAQNFLVFNGEKKNSDQRRHAEAWVAKNKVKFDGWIAEAKQAAAKAAN